MTKTNTALAREIEASLIAMIEAHPGYDEWPVFIQKSWLQMVARRLRYAGETATELSTLRQRHSNQVAAYQVETKELRQQLRDVTAKIEELAACYLRQRNTILDQHATNR